MCYGTDFIFYHFQGVQTWTGLSLASLRGRLISTSFGWGKGGNVTSAGWQVTLCDPMWHVSSRSGVATLRTAIHLLLTYTVVSLC